MPIDTEILALRPAVARQYIDSVAVFEAHEEALTEAAQVRGGMYWHKGPASAPDASYLVRTTATGGETSLGSRSKTTERIHAKFFERKRASDERLAGLKASLQDHCRLNRALRVGRVDPLITSILSRLALSNLGEHFRVVGTHALYAYEAAASINFEAGAVATRDIDLLWDTRMRMRFATRLAKIDSSMLGVLKKVDPSFRIRKSQKYTAVNKDGFEVDIIRRVPVDGDPHPMRMSDDEDDFWVAQAPNAHILLDSPPFSAVIVASNGDMARMNTLHPLAFAKFKRWMAKQPGREPAKRGRDALQARLIEQAVHAYLPHLARDATQAPASG